MEDAKEKLDKLLERRKNYFLLEGIKRKIYQYEFEKIQKQIMHLKLCLNLYHDELDILEVRFDFGKEVEKIKICEEAEKNGELRWIKKSYYQEQNEAVYVTTTNGNPTNEWLKELFDLQKEKREGLINCPWQTNID